jgi:hypothetical protein
MNNSAELLSNAELSLAAYANLDNGTLDSDIQRDALINIGMTEIQAQRFSTNYSVVTQFNDTNTGFSATVFKDASGNLTLAFRGTEQITEDLLFTEKMGTDLFFNDSMKRRARYAQEGASDTEEYAPSCGAART